MPSLQMKAYLHICTKEEGKKKSYIVGGWVAMCSCEPPATKMGDNQIEDIRKRVKNERINKASVPLGYFFPFLF